MRMKRGLAERVIGWVLTWILVASAGAAHAQGPSASGRIVADSSPYHLEWNGTSGTFVRNSLPQEPGQRYTLTYLHADPGPQGHSKYLAWFLARSADSFAILWCYLNDSGSQFWCWLYRYPENQLTTQNFTGDYAFTSGPDADGTKTQEPFTLNYTPRYAGPDFQFGDWTRKMGRISQLELHLAGHRGGTPDPTLPPVADTVRSDSTSAPLEPPVRSLSRLRVYPLKDVRVDDANGWRANGWHELHALAFDASSDPYYLILYSNTPRGFVIDLKRAATYVADYGATVRFDTDTAPVGGNNDTVEKLPAISVRRYRPHEITLTTKTAHANPFTDVSLLADFTTPNGKHLLVPGFWDGGGTWHVRFVPTLVGSWHWRTRSSDTELDGKEGDIDCTESDGSEHGFLRVHSSYSYHHHFELADGTPLLPAYLRDSVHFEPQPIALRGQANAGSPTALPSASPDGTGSSLPASFRAFQGRVDASAALGFNRFVGGWLLDRTQFDAKTQANEGGVPFLDYDLDRPNPAYFQWMDKRIGYCNQKGIIPDIGLGWPEAGLFTNHSLEQLRRVWKYVLARYASYNVCWNLFGVESGPLPAPGQIALFTKLTADNDPYHHLLTVMTPGPLDIAPYSDAPTPKPRSRTRASSRPKTKTPPDTTMTGESDDLNTLDNPDAGPVLPTYADKAWQSMITLLGGDLNTLDYAYRYNKPVLLLERPARAPEPGALPLTGMTPEIARQRLWETRMRGAYWAGDIAPAWNGPETLAADEVQWAAACARFFRLTRYWRLDPHPDLLESPPDPTRRRHRMPADTSPMPNANPQQTLLPTGKSPDVPMVALLPASPPAIFALADPAWEYVIYFEKGGTTPLDLLEATGRLKLMWFNPRTGKVEREDSVVGGSYVNFTAPDSNDWILYLSRR